MFTDQNDPIHAEIILYINQFIGKKELFKEAIANLEYNYKFLSYSSSINTKVVNVLTSLYLSDNLSIDNLKLIINI